MEQHVCNTLIDYRGATEKWWQFKDSFQPISITLFDSWNQIIVLIWYGEDLIAN